MMRRRWTFRVLALVPILVGACGGRGGDAEPARPSPPPDLSGLRVMLMPAPTTAPGALDPELAFWLQDRYPATDWILPEQLQAAADRSPAWRLRLETLPRPVSERARGDLRVLDPLYGALRRLGAVVDADWAVVPVAVTALPAEEGVRVAITTAVVYVRGARVFWMHTVTGEAAPDAAGAAASAAETLARTLGGG